MTYEDTEDALVSIALAARECRAHGAEARITMADGITVARPRFDIYDADNGDHWGAVRIEHGDQVNARAVLAVLGY